MRPFGPYPAFRNTGLNESDDCLWQSLILLCGVFAFESFAIPFSAFLGREGGFW